MGLGRAGQTRREKELVRYRSKRNHLLHTTPTDRLHRAWRWIQRRRHRQSAVAIYPKSRSGTLTCRVGDPARRRKRRERRRHRKDDVLHQQPSHQIRHPSDPQRRRGLLQTKNQERKRRIRTKETRTSAQTIGRGGNGQKKGRRRKEKDESVRSSDERSHPAAKRTKTQTRGMERQRLAWEIGSLGIHGTECGTCCRTRRRERTGRRHPAEDGLRNVQRWCPPTARRHRTVGCLRNSRAETQRNLRTGNKKLQRTHPESRRRIDRIHSTRRGPKQKDGSDQHEGSNHRR
mmetsp:Transcript_10796/g.66680  ORF Transcript_10796/g.66680 Transcript_10796/m.66680 type:complete len:289 (+) Transcript_10796:267-1133(+)